jgi:hypothetical protein
LAVALGEVQMDYWLTWATITAALTRWPKATSARMEYRFFRCVKLAKVRIVAPEAELADSFGRNWAARMPSVGIAVLIQRRRFF